MADLKHYRLKALGPLTAIAGVENSSIKLANGVKTVDIRGQSLATQHSAARLVIPELTFTDKATMYAPDTFSAVSAFGLHFIAQSDAGGDGTGVISYVADAFRVPLSVSADKGGEASTQVRLMFKSGLTVGTTTKTLTAATDLYKIGATTFNGTAVDNIESQEVQFGLDVWTNAGQTGSLYATEMVVRQHDWTITIVTTDLSLIGAYLGGAVLSSSAALVKFASIASPSSGYGYTATKAFVTSMVNVDDPTKGTLTLRPYGGVTLSGASY